MKKHLTASHLIKNLLNVMIGERPYMQTDDLLWINQIEIQDRKCEGKL